MPSFVYARRLPVLAILRTGAVVVVVALFVFVVGDSFDCGSIKHSVQQSHVISSQSAFRSTIL